MLGTENESSEVAGATVHGHACDCNCREDCELHIVSNELFIVIKMSWNMHISHGKEWTVIALGEDGKLSLPDPWCP